MRVWDAFPPPVPLRSVADGWFEVWGLGVGVWGCGLGVGGLGLWVWGLRFWVSGFGFRV